jgi:hypothetical protein
MDECEKLKAEKQLKADDFLNNLPPVYPSNTSRDVPKHNIAVPPSPNLNLLLYHCIYSAFNGL